MIQISKFHLQSLTLGEGKKGRKRGTKRDNEGATAKNTIEAGWTAGGQVRMAAPPLHLILQASSKTCPCRGKFIQLFVGATDRYADFTTSLRLNANFTLAPRALRSDLDRAKFAPGFEA